MAAQLLQAHQLPLADPKRFRTINHRYTLVQPLIDDRGFGSLKPNRVGASHAICSR